MDDYIWDLAREELDVSISEFVENQLRTYLDEDDELSVLMKEEANLQNKLNSIQAKICNLRERKHDEKVRKKEFDNAMISINSIHNELGYVGKNQIKFIAKKNDLSTVELLEHCRDEELNITNFGEIPKK